MATLPKKQKPMARCVFGMVAGRACGDEGVGRAAVEHRIHAAIMPPTPVSAASHDPGLAWVSGSSETIPVLGIAVADGVDIGLRMPQKKVGLGRQWRLLPRKAGKGGRGERGVDRLQPGDLFGVAGRRNMVQPRGVLDQQRGHGLPQSGASM
jgi:hypothetical protein